MLQCKICTKTWSKSEDWLQQSECFQINAVTEVASLSLALSLILRLWRLTRVFLSLMIWPRSRLARSRLCMMLGLRATLSAKKERSVDPLDSDARSSWLARVARYCCTPKSDLRLLPSSDSWWRVALTKIFCAKVGFVDFLEAKSILIGADGEHSSLEQVAELDEVIVSKTFVLYRCSLGQVCHFLQHKNNRSFRKFMTLFPNMLSNNFI